MTTAPPAPPAMTLAAFVRVNAGTSLRAQLAAEAGSLVQVAAYVRVLLAELDEAGEALEREEIDARIGELEAGLRATHQALEDMRARRARPAGTLIQ